MYLQTHVSITYMYVHIHVDIYTCTMYINVYIVVCSTSGSQVEMGFWTGKMELKSTIK